MLGNIAFDTFFETHEEYLLVDLFRLCIRADRELRILRRYDMEIIHEPSLSQSEGKVNIRKCHP
jgi:hypothetical protein